MNDARHVEGQVLLSETRPQTLDDLFGEITQVEDTLIGVMPVVRHLLE
jgi:hypothetical protein